MHMNFSKSSSCPESGDFRFGAVGEHSSGLPPNRCRNGPGNRNRRASAQSGGQRPRFAYHLHSNPVPTAAPPSAVGSAQACTVAFSACSVSGSIR